MAKNFGIFGVPMLWMSSNCDIRNLTAQRLITSVIKSE